MEFETKRDKYGKNVKNIAIISFLLFLDLVFLLWMMSPTDINRASTERKDIPKANGAVINIWLDSVSRLDNLKEHDVKYLFVDTGGVENGKFLEEERIDSFIEFVVEYEEREDHDFVLLPYREISSYQNDIISQEFKENFINGYISLLGKGYDGILVDIEPVRLDQRDEFLELLEEVKNSSATGTVAVYSGHIVKWKSNNVWEWDVRFYEDVAERVDLISAPGYDTELRTANEYKDHIKNQIEIISSINGANVLFAIPTHKPYPELSVLALEAYSEEIADHPNTPIIGITVFAEWTASDYDWKNLDELGGVTR